MYSKRQLRLKPENTASNKHGQSHYLFHCLLLFIPATNLDDTKTIFDDEATNLVMINICS
jgi:hypothetical protein